jgi:hypothetical protein
MSVKYDKDAEALIKFLDGFDEFNKDYVQQIDKELKGKGKTGANIIEQHFQKSPRRGGNLPKLEESTLKAKKGPKKLVEKGSLKAATLKPQKPKVKGKSVVLFAKKIPEYGDHLTKGIPSKSGTKVYNFFNLFWR